MGERICIMKDGRLVQVGPPLEVYRNPADTFVAGFLASPPMNLLNARLVGEGGALLVEHGATRLPIPLDHVAAYAARRDKPVILGLRPEEIHDYAPSSEAQAIDVKVVTIEALGPETILIAEMPGGAEVSARLGRNYRAPIGAAQRLFVEPSRLHLFDPATTRAIPRPPAR